MTIATASAVSVLDAVMEVAAQEAEKERQQARTIESLWEALTCNDIEKARDLAGKLRGRTITMTSPHLSAYLETPREEDLGQ